MSRLGLEGGPRGGTHYQTVHQWMNRNFPRVGRCEWCAKSGKTEYASASHDAYTRNRADWFEFCRRCHLAFDGRLGHMKGRTHSEDARAKISAARQKQVSPMTGRTHSAEARAKIGAAGKGRTPTPEARAKMSNAARLAWARRKEAAR